MQPFCSTFFLQPVRESFGRSSISASLLAARNGKAFAVDPGYAPIPSKLVSKITSGQFVNPANLLTKNLHAQELEPHTFLDGKLLVAPTKKQVIEITDILPWMQTFSIYSWIFCTALPLWWQDFTQYHSLIMQMVRQFPGSVWQNYDTAFCKGAVASGIMDWSKMNLDLYNFHTRIPSAGSQLSSSHSRPTPPGGLPTLLNTAVHGTMTNAAGHLGHADTITFVWVARARIVTISSPLPGAALSATDAGVALSSSASNPVNSVYSGHCNVSFSVCDFVPVLDAVSIPAVALVSDIVPAGGIATDIPSEQTRKSPLPHSWLFSTCSDPSVACPSVSHGTGSVPSVSPSRATCRW